MVNRLDIDWDTKQNLKRTLKKFPSIFGGGLGKLKGEKAHITLKKGTNPRAGHYYNLP